MAVAGGTTLREPPFCQPIEGATDRAFWKAKVPGKIERVDVGMGVTKEIAKNAEASMFQSSDGLQRLQNISHG